MVGLTSHCLNTDTLIWSGKFWSINDSQHWHMTHTSPRCRWGDALYENKADFQLHKHYSSAFVVYKTIIQRQQFSPDQLMHQNQIQLIQYEQLPATRYTEYFDVFSKGQDNQSCSATSWRLSCFTNLMSY